MYFQVYQDTRNEWRWRIKAANNETIANSAESYRNKEDCIHGVNLVKQGAAGAPIK